MSFSQRVWQPLQKIFASDANRWEQAMADSDITNPGSVLSTQLSATYMPLPGGTKTTGFAPVVQANGTVVWAQVAASGGGFSPTIGPDGNYHISGS